MKLIGPMKCDHWNSELLTAGLTTSDDGYERFSVTLCPRCGQFRVIANRNNQHIFITFELVVTEHLEMANRHIEYINQSEDNNNESS